MRLTGSARQSQAIDQPIDNLSPFAYKANNAVAFDEEPMIRL